MKDKIYIKIKILVLARSRHGMLIWHGAPSHFNSQDKADTSCHREDLSTLLIFYILELWTSKISFLQPLCA